MNAYINEWMTTGCALLFDFFDEGNLRRLHPRNLRRRILRRQTLRPAVLWVDGWVGDSQTVCLHRDAQGINPRVALGTSGELPVRQC